MYVMLNRITGKIYKNRFYKSTRCSKPRIYAMFEAELVNTPAGPVIELTMLPTSKLTEAEFAALNQKVYDREMEQAQIYRDQDAASRRRRGSDYNGFYAEWAETSEASAKEVTKLRYSDLIYK